MPFERWLIEGTLTTLSPLHIGDGEHTHRPNEPRLRDGDVPVEINSVAVAADTGNGHKPFIPATALKGALRAWVERSGLATAGPVEKDFHQVFGLREHGGLGGKAEFADALWASQLTRDNSSYWDHARSTCVTSCVAIDRDYRTVADKKLHHHEYVPAGVTFHLRIAAKSMTPGELSLLLRALQALDGESSGVTLGAANGDGWGRVKFTCTAIRKMDAAGVLNWLRRGALGVLNDSLVPLPPAEQAALCQAGAALGPPQAKAQLTMKITLRFRDFFLVNDPQRAKIKGVAGQDSNLPNFAPRRLPGENGGALLNAESFRGRMRAQMERIVRTIGGPRAAFDPSRHEKQMAIHGSEEFNRLDPVSLLFGAPGWKAPLSLTDFTPADGGSPGQLSEQEFLAIDRFLGGGADHLKFNGQSFYQPVLTGRITIDLERLAETRCAGPATFALLAFLLRDLKEGDLTFGYGASKGYGACDAVISEIAMTGWDTVRERLGFGLEETPPVEALSFEPQAWTDDTRYAFFTYAQTLPGQLREFAPAE